MQKLLATMIGAVALAGAATGAQQSASALHWLDRPLSNWNLPAKGMPRAAIHDERRVDLLNRCKLQLRRSTSSERALADAGWIPFLHLDRQILQRDVEIVGAMAAADGMCRPADFNVFVFVGGFLAGTLSPAPMTSRLDGSIGAVRLASNDTVTAEFARYRTDDPLCCPSSHVTVRFRIERTPASSTVVPTEIVATRR